MHHEEIGHARVAWLDDDGATLGPNDLLNDVIAQAWSMEADLVAIPITRLGPEFWDLSTGVAGAVLQRLVQYHLRVAIVGYFTAQQASSGALRNFVAESNRGRHVWFVDDEAQLAERLVRP